MHLKISSSKWQLIGPWKIQLETEIGHFQTHINDRYLGSLLWICPQEKDTRLLWWLVNIGSGYTLLLDGTLPEPMLIKLYDAIWCHWATMSCYVQFALNIPSIGHVTLVAIAGTTILVPCLTFESQQVIQRRGSSLVKKMYRKISNIRRTKSQNLNVSRLVLQLFSPNPMKPGVKSRMKM